MADMPIRRALIAVYDKTGIVEFARALVDEFGIEIISTGGTAKHLKDAGVPVTMVEEVTGFPELLDGRVKTLHPKIHAGILADRDNPEHMRQLEQHGIKPIDMVVVNLYPFEKTVADPNCTFEQAIEMVDIGGPCMLRAAAKNHKHVLAVMSRRDFAPLLDSLRKSRNITDDGFVKTWQAISVFNATSSYDHHIKSFLLNASVYAKDMTAGVEGWRELTDEERDACMRPLDLPVFACCPEPLRYGENPHQRAQKAGLMSGANGPSLTRESSEEKEAAGSLSFNNYADADAALSLCAELSRVNGKVWHRLIAGDETLHGSGQLQPISTSVDTRRNLPHIQRPGATYFVTFRVRSGELAQSERDLAMECCLFVDGKKAIVHAVTIMPDHVHIVATPMEASPDAFYQLGDILHGIKGMSGRRIADLRGRGSGPVWQDESFDRIMRGQKEFSETLEYVRQNPVTAGIAREGEYPWCVYDPDAGWDKYNDSAGMDAGHRLICDCLHTKRDWHRLLAGATPSGSTPVGVPADSNILQADLQESRMRDPRTPQAQCAVFIKHTNSCGIGIASDPIEAYRRAYLGDPNAAMGGILAVNFPVTASFAEVVMDSLQKWGKDAGAGAFFVEVLVAPSFEDNAIQVIRTRKKWGEKVRLLAVGPMDAEPDPDELDYKRIAGGMLVQSRDYVGLNEDQWKVVTKRKPTDAEMADLRLAWLIAKHTKSNAISICKDGMLIGNGAGQMSRVMSCRIATWLAKENGHADKLPGSAAASDAFFPFRDGPDILIDAGVTALIQPGGSKRDEETIAACDERNVAMIFTGTRHFKH